MPGQQIGDHWGRATQHPRKRSLKKKNEEKWTRRQENSVKKDKRYKVQKNLGKGRRTAGGQLEGG